MSNYRYVTDYTIFAESDPLRLEQSVKEAFHDGWQPLGGAFFAMDTVHTTFGHAAPQPLWCQTMVLRIPRKKENDT